VVKDKKMQGFEGVAALLEPRSIAIVGATPRADSLGGRPALNLRTQGYGGRVYSVNPRYPSIGDAVCYPHLTALPEPVDLVMVLVGADRVLETLDQAVAAQAKSAIVFGGGFAELGPEGAARQAQLTGYAAKGLRICGPNCNGVFNVRAGIAMGFSPAFEAPSCKGRVALISQSGAIATGVSSRGMQNGIGFSHVVATGNEADLEVADFIEYLTDDPDVVAFACFIEGFKNPQRFLRVARAALRVGKPIVAIKAGRSAGGQAMSMSHTGSMTGSYEVLAGVMRQAGVVVAETLDELLGFASVFGTGIRPDGGGAAVMSLSGGMASLIADQCSEQGVPLATFSPDTNIRLREVMPAIATVSNPLDVTGQVVTDPALWSNCANAIAADPGVDATVAILSILAGHADRRVSQDVLDAGEGKLLLAVWASAAPAECGIDMLRAAGMPVFLRAEDAVRALSVWRGYWNTREPRIANEVPIPVIAKLGDVGDAWALLDNAGLPVARHAVVGDAASLAATLAGLRFPLALKIQSDDIPHKTELNLLRLGVKTPEDARAAFDTLTADARRVRPDARIDGVLVQEMFSGRRELILGVRHEPNLGPAVVFGLGGIFSEVMRDVSVRLAPVSAFDVDEMIAELRGAALLGPIRGLGAARAGLLADVIGRFSSLVLQHAGTLAEFEINPLILADDGQSCAAVDVLVGLQEATSP
jgi:acyl-CoA synthetase (NDP forming)